MLDEFITRGGPIKYGDKILIFGIAGTVPGKLSKIMPRESRITPAG